MNSRSTADVEPGALIVLGVDGARFDDALAVIATEIETGYQWPISIWRAPPSAGETYEHDLDAVDGAVIDAFDRFEVWRIYIDPGSNTGNIEPLVEKWQGRWGEKRVIKWFMHRPRQTAFAVSSYTAAINTGEVSHDGDEVFSRHIKNAVRWPVNVTDDEGRKLHVIGKDRQGLPEQDGRRGGRSALSWEARGDAIAADAKRRVPAQSSSPRKEPAWPKEHLPRGLTYSSTGFSERWNRWKRLRRLLRGRPPLSPWLRSVQRAFSGHRPRQLLLELTDNYMPLVVDSARRSA
jgi:hypothetical protein